MDPQVFKGPATSQGAVRTARPVPLTDAMRQQGLVRVL